jgi:hypothetical protein
MNRTPEKVPLKVAPVLALLVTLALAGTCAYWAEFKLRALPGRRSER